MKTYSNPRMKASIEGWPHGSLRTTAHFEIECNSRGERAVRTTINPKTGQPSAPKALTYACKQRIVDGDDGRTYIVCLTDYDTVSVMRGDMALQEEHIHSNSPGYAEALALFKED